jgi:hypothetical protein
VEAAASAGVADGTDFAVLGPRTTRGALVFGMKLASGWRVGGSAQVMNDHGEPHRPPVSLQQFVPSPLELRNGTRVAASATASAHSPDNRWFVFASARHTNKDADLSSLQVSPALDIFGYRTTAVSALARFRPVESAELNLGGTLSNWGAFVDERGTAIGADVANHDLFLEGHYSRKIQFAR